MVGVRVVQGVQVPAPVGGEARHRVHAVVDQAPQVLRRGDPTRIAAAHPHDDDRVVGYRRGHGCRRCRRGAEQLVAEVRGQRGHRRVVEHDARRQPQPGGRGEPVPQLHRGQRVEAQLLEGTRRVDGAGALVVQHLRDLAEDEVGERTLAVGRRAPRQVVRGAHGPRGSPGGCEVAQHGRNVVARADRREVEPGRHGQRLVAAERGVEQGEAVGRGQRRGAQAGEPPGVVLGERAGHPGRPRPPRHRGRGQAPGAPVLGQRVQERVRRGVARLPGRAERAGQGGEHDEGGVLAGQLVQVPGSVHFGP